MTKRINQGYILLNKIPRSEEGWWTGNKLVGFTAVWRADTTLKQH